MLTKMCSLLRTSQRDSGQLPKPLQHASRTLTQEVLTEMNKHKPAFEDDYLINTTKVNLRNMPFLVYSEMEGRLRS